MKTNEALWKLAYSQNWGTLFNALPEDQRTLILASPEGSEAAKLAAQASELADRDYADSLATKQ